MEEEMLLTDTVVKRPTDTAVKPAPPKVEVIKRSKFCNCEKDTLINRYISCDTFILKNKNLLYYHFDCDSVRLFIEDKNAKKYIVNAQTNELYPYHHRLAYRLLKEYDKYLLFRYGCAASSATCGFSLVDKNNGKELENFDTENASFAGLIYDYERIKVGKEDYYKERIYDFILYFTDDMNSITIHYVDSGKKFKIPIQKRHFHAVVPRHQFTEIKLKNEVLELTYDISGPGGEGKNTIRVDTKTHK